jgi:hypothetical protein
VGPPRAVCVAGHCALDYPALDDRCERDDDCITLPALVPAADAGTCRLACGRVVGANKLSGRWASGLWRNASVAGRCPPGCTTELQPRGACRGGRCVAPTPTTARVANASFRSPWTDGPLAPDVLIAVATSGAADLYACREGPRAVSLPGSWSVGLELRVAPDGRVAQASVVALAAIVPAITSCLEAAIRGWRFPASDAGADARVMMLVDLRFEVDR